MYIGFSVVLVTVILGGKVILSTLKVIFSMFWSCLKFLGYMLLKILASCFSSIKKKCRRCSKCCRKTGGSGRRNSDANLREVRPMSDISI